MLINAPASRIGGGKRLVWWTQKNESGGRRDSLIGRGSLSRYQLGDVSLR